MPSPYTLLAIGALVAGLSPAPAAHAGSFTAAFSPIRINAKPGDVVTTHVTIALGAGPRAIDFHAHMEDWWRTADGLTTYYRPAGTLRRSCAQWITLDPADQQVKPGDRLDVRLSISVPAGTAPGGYWCAVTIDEQADPLTVARRTGISFVASFSTGVYVYIAPLKRDAVITDVRVDGAHVDVALRNLGDTPLHTNGTVELRLPGRDEVVAIVTLDKNVLLPEPIGHTVLRGKLPDAATVPDGRYSARAIVDIGLEHYLGAEKVLQVTHAISVKAP